MYKTIFSTYFSTLSTPATTPKAAIKYHLEFAVSQFNAHKDYKFFSLFFSCSMLSKIDTLLHTYFQYNIKRVNISNKQCFFPILISPTDFYSISLSLFSTLLQQFISSLTKHVPLLNPLHYLTSLLAIKNCHRVVSGSRYHSLYGFFFVLYSQRSTVSLLTSMKKYIHTFVRKKSMISSYEKFNRFFKLQTQEFIKLSAPLVSKGDAFHKINRDSQSERWAHHLTVGQVIKITCNLLIFSKYP